jgi:hypothetical protein
LPSPRKRLRLLPMAAIFKVDEERRDSRGCPRDTAAEKNEIMFPMFPRKCF